MRGGYLWVGAIWSYEGAEGGPIKHGGVQGGDPHSQVFGGDADRRTLELDLLNQLVYGLQRSDGEEPRRRANIETRRVGHSTIEYTVD